MTDAPLPYADDLFPSKSGDGLPDADALFPDSIDVANERRKARGGVPSPIQDFLFSRADQGGFTAARILSHFGQGFKHGWGAEPLGLSDDSRKKLQALGWLKDYETGQADIAKAANESLFRPAALSLADSLRFGPLGTIPLAAEAGLRAIGGGLKGVTTTIAETGADLGQPRLGRELAGMVEYLTTVHPRPIAGPAGAAMPTYHSPVGLSESLLLRARAANVIGADEAAWKGVAKPAEAPRAAEPVPQPVSPIEQVFAAAKDEPSPVTTAARGIAPDLFYRYDEVQARRDRLSGEMAELNDMRARDAAQQQEIDALKAKVAENLTKAEAESREMAPAVREAYTEAQKTAEAERPVPAEPAKPIETPERPIEAQRAFIQGDVREKMIAAGRSEAEADAAAAIDAAYWETRAARFGGHKGTAEEMYRKEAPEILGPGMRSDYDAPRAKPKYKEIGLLQYIASRGGIADNDPLIADVRQIIGAKNKLIPGFGALIRKGGKFLDNHREAAVEQRYMVDREGKSTVADLLDAMDGELRGRKLRPEGEEPVLEAAKFAEDNRVEIERALDNGLRDVGLDPKAIPEEVRARAIELMETEVSDPIAAYERAERETGMFQGGEIKRGSITPTEDGRNTIRLLKDANASTFIHEKGHDYLFRLMRDANDDLAPAGLRADAETTLKWLGVDDASQIKRRHHEKFARGFENYIMEGRAPSHALARVFEQFRQWLLRIYSEAARLKAPLNDDIRGVFNRMLAVDPQEVVIAPDRAPAELAASHEALEASPAPVAADVAGAVRAERDTMAGRLGPDEQDARLAEIAAGLERHAPGGAEPNRPLDAAEPPAAGGGTGGSPVELGTVGGEAARQAPEVAQKPAERVAQPTEPHQPFAPHTDIVDKAGNIRLDTITAPEDVKNVIRRVADQNDEFQHVRGPVTDIQVAELADAMGMDAAYLSTRKIGEAWTAPQIVALRRLLIQSATELRDLMAKAASGDENAVLAYAEAKAKHIVIQESVSSVTAQAGRALRAFQRQFTGDGMNKAQALGAFLKKETGLTLFQLQREAQLGMSLETPAQVSKFVNDGKKATTTQMIQEAWINALLSGPITHVKNIIGNTMVAILGVPETAATAGVGKLRQVLGHDGERVSLGDAGANLYGLIQGARDGLSAAKYAFLHEEQYRSAQTVEQPKYQAIPSKRIVLQRYEPGSPEYNARLEEFAKARARAERLTGERLEARVEQLKADPTPDMVLDAGEKAIEIGGKQIRTPGRLLTAEDELFKTIAYRQKINELAYRQARNEGLAGDAAETRMAQLAMNPTEEMATAAQKHADYQTFTNTLGETGRALQQFANSHVLAKMVLPFVRTPLNLLKYASERTPLGAFSREVRANLSGANGKIAQDTQIARMAIGTGLGITAMALADQGYITGGGPSDKGEKATLMLSGWRPYSVRIGDTYYSYAWLDPFSTIFGIAADLADAAKKMTGDEGEEIGKIAANLFASISKNILSKASLRGASDLINAATDPDRYGDKYLQNLAGTVIPSVVAQQAKAHDEYQREARTMLDALKARIPGLRKDLLPKRDIWGEPIAVGDNLGPDSFSPIALSKLTKDPATQALIDAELFPAKLQHKIRGVELTGQQYDDYSRIAGRMAKMRVNAIVSNAGFAQAPVEVRSELLKKAINSSREAARSMIMMQNPGIFKEALDNKLSAVGR